MVVSAVTGWAVNLKSLLGHVAVVISRLHMEGALEGVLLAGDEVLVGDRIHHGRRGVLDHVLVAVMPRRRQWCQARGESR